MDKTDCIALLLLLGLLSGLPYIAYKMGRYYERRDLTTALVAQIEDTYYQGRADAEKDCREGSIK
jgi:hypothetical protein